MFSVKEKVTTVWQSRNKFLHPEDTYARLRYFFSSLQFRESWLIISIIIVVSGFLLSTAWLIHRWKDIPIGKLLRDLVIVADVPLYYGFLSQLGIFFWSASASICLFCYAHLPRTATGFGSKNFFLAAGVLTLVLGFDDAFLLHDEILPWFGITEYAVFIGYALFMAYFLVRFYLPISKSRYILLAIALVSFGVSIIVDGIELEDTAGRLLEDGAKLVGMLSWLAYFAHTGLTAIRCDAERE